MFSNNQMAGNSVNVNIFNDNHFRPTSRLPPENQLGFHNIAGLTGHNIFHVKQPKSDTNMLFHLAIYNLFQFDSVSDVF